MSAVLLHAANFTGTYSSIALIDPMVSYRELVQEKNYDPSLIPFAVANSLPHYDLPDLLENLSDISPLVLQGNSVTEPSGPQLLPERTDQEKIDFIRTTDREERRGYLRQWLNP